MAVPIFKEVRCMVPEAVYRDLQTIARTLCVEESKAVSAMLQAYAGKTLAALKIFPDGMLSEALAASDPEGT